MGFDEGRWRRCEDSEMAVGGASASPLEPLAGEGREGKRYRREEAEKGEGHEEVEISGREGERKRDERRGGGRMSWVLTWMPNQLHISM